MNIRAAVAVLIVVAVVAGIWAFVGGSSKPVTRMVPAWQLLPADRYHGDLVVDPFVSWSPDSKSAILSEFPNNGTSAEVYRWYVGGKRLEVVAEGLGATFVDEGRFVYMKNHPKGIYEYDLATGKSKEIVPKIKSSDLWNETRSVIYDPKRRTVALRLVKYSRRYEPGTEEYDMGGNLVGKMPTGLGGNVVDYSCDPRGSKRAIVVDHGPSQTLETADKASVTGQKVASGQIGAVAWSPSDDLVAYGESSHVEVVRPSDGKTVVVARFDPPTPTSDGRYVSRLSWSPNGEYLAVLVYVVGSRGDYPLVFVLDMSKLKLDG